MKLILAIVSNDDSGAVSSALTRGGFSVTKLPPQNAGCAQYLHHGCGHVLLFSGGSYRGRLYHFRAERRPF